MAYDRGMCGRISMTYRERQLLAEELGIPPESVPEDYQARYNIAPTQPYFVVRERQEQRQLVTATWGLVNSWAKDGRGAARQINARAESVDRAPAFREAFRKRRCIVPVDGFYEWTGDKKHRQPFWFHRPNGGLLLMAGLHESFQTSPGEWQRTFAIVTTNSNGLVGRIHDRMPVILSDDAVAHWLYEHETDFGRLKSLLTPAADDYLVARTVSQAVNNARLDDPSMVEEVVGVQLSLV
jgi:putative SOS response-associated peptidase YedK